MVFTAIAAAGGTAIPPSFAEQRKATEDGWWERARLANALRSDMKERAGGEEMRLRQKDSGAWEMTMYVKNVHRIMSAGDRSWQVNSPGPRDAELRVEALRGDGEGAKCSQAVLTGAEVVLNGSVLKIPFDMSAGEYAELIGKYWTLFDERGEPKRRMPCSVQFSLAAGDNELSFRAPDPDAKAEVTVLCIGRSEWVLTSGSGENRSCIDEEVDLPVFYAPSLGFDQLGSLPVRVARQARLGLEVLGPVDTPSVLLVPLYRSEGGRKYVFPVKLAEGERLACGDGAAWTVERLGPSGWAKVSEGRLEKPILGVESPQRVTFGAKDPKTCRARFTFTKHYLKHFREWTMEEIKAGVTESGDEVSIAYEDGGFPLASITDGGVERTHRARIGNGRSILSRVFVVPAAIYDTAKVRVKVDPDPGKDRVFTLRMTRYNDGIEYGGRSLAGMMNLEVDFDKAEKRHLGGDLWELSVPLDMGCIADLVWGGDTFGTWMCNVLRKTGYAPRKGLENYLDFEVLPRLLKRIDPNSDIRMLPDDTYTSAITLHGVVLHRAGVSFKVVQSQPANVFASDEKPETSVEVDATSAGPWALRIVVRDVDGAVLRDEAMPFSGRKTFVVDLAQKTVGWYALDFAIERGGRAILMHRGSFALLPPDTRKEGTGEGPYGTWTWGSGNHYAMSDIREFGPLLKKAGFRRAEGISGKVGHPYMLSPQDIRWDRSSREVPVEERIASVRKQLEDNPNVKICMMLSESAPLSYQQAWELTGQKVPDPKTFGVAGWLSCSNPEKAGLAARAKRFAQVMEQGKILRENFPDVKISIGNSQCCTELIAEVLRQGLPKEYVDYMGLESYCKAYLPEREGDHAMQAADLMMQLAKAFGCDKWRPNGCWEASCRLDWLISTDRQAAWYVRDALLEQAWGFHDIFIGIITDAGNSYAASYWGRGGLCGRMSTAYPKPAYVGIATVTRLLDQVVSSRRIPCGDECVYVNEYTRKDGKCVTALWTSRGNAEVALDVSSDAGALEYVDFYGRPFDGGSVVKVGEFAKYVVSPARAIRAARVGRRDFPGWDSEPSGSRLVAKTDDVSEWRLEPTTNATIEATTGPILPYRTFGQYEVRGVVDEERGPCIELELVKPNMALPLIMHEYAVLELKKPVPLDGDPATLGAWVKGNSGWGKFYWVIEDEKGVRHYSCGGKGNVDYFDHEGALSLCYTGWNFLKMGLDERTSKHSLTAAKIPGWWRPYWYGNGKLKLAGIAFDAQNRPLFLTERRPHRQVVRIGGIYALDYPAVR